MEIHIIKQMYDYHSIVERNKNILSNIIKFSKALECIENEIINNIEKCIENLNNQILSTNENIRLLRIISNNLLY